MSFQNVQSGKPIFREADASTDNIRFNLCHSHGRALIAVSNDLAVGVDLENILTDRDVTALGARFFAPQEQAAIMNAGSSAKHWAFSRIWGAKEAVLKAGGSWLTFPRDRHCIELSADGTACRLIVADESLWIVQLVIQVLPLEEGWVGALAAEGNGWKVGLGL